MKIKLAFVLGMALFLLAAREGQAQFIHEGSNIIGLSVGLNFTESGVPIGANYEYMVQRDVGVGGIFRYWSYSIPYAYGSAPNGKWVWTSFIVGAQGNYHFRVPQRELDPFVGAILAYRSTSGSAQNSFAPSGFSPEIPSKVVFAIQAGARYFVSDNIDVTGRLIFGRAAITLLKSAEIL
jgi:hypothetical protein